MNKMKFTDSLDSNDITFENILRNPEFKRCQSQRNIRAAAAFEMFIEENFPEIKEREKVESGVLSYVVDSEDAAFVQGFSFAVKLMKFIDKAG